MKWIFPLLILFSACTSKTHWTYDKMTTCPAPYASSFLHYPPENELSGVGIEILRGAFGTVGYAYVTCRTIPSLPDEPAHSIVVLTVGEEKFPYKAERMDGGQRLLLPEEATEHLLASLYEEQSVKLYLNGFMSELSTPSTPRRLRHILKRFNSK